MVDEIFDRQYQAGRQELHASLDGIGRRLAAFANGFKLLNRIPFAAPWAKKSARCA